MASLHSFLVGITVLDLSQYIPGPFASLMLADMGATILKIEPPSGDAMRDLGPCDSQGQPVYYHALNAGKTILRLDLKTEAGRQALLERVMHADILLEGFRAGVMQRLGLAYADLATLNPRLIYCSISGYGATGPLAATAAHDGNFLATSGVMDRNGVDKPGFFDPPVADMTGALFALTAILGALHARHGSGRGAHIDLGLADSLMPLQLLQIAEWAANGTVPRRQQSYLNGGAAYYQVYPTADSRYVMLAAVERKFWANFCHAADRPDWLARHGESLPQKELTADVGSFFSIMPLQTILARFRDAECCLSAVLDLGEALTSVQVRVRQTVRQTEDGMQALFPAIINGEPPDCRAPLAHTLLRAVP